MRAAGFSHISGRAQIGKLRLILLAACMVPGELQAQKWPISNCSSLPNLTGFECFRAYDNNTSSVWRSNGTGWSFISFDLSKAANIKRIVLKSTSSHPTWIYVSSSDDGSNWTYRFPINVQTGTTDVNLEWSNVFSYRHIILEFMGEPWDLQEAEFHGPGVYNEDEILVKHIPLGFWNMNGSSLTVPSSEYSSIPMNRVIGLNTIIFDNNGNAYHLERFSDNCGADTKNHGGNTLFRMDASGVWTLEVMNGTFFKKRPEFSGIAVQRGYVSIYYLSRDPDFP